MLPGRDLKLQQPYGFIDRFNLVHSDEMNGALALFYGGPFFMSTAIAAHAPIDE